MTERSPQRNPESASIPLSQQSIGFQLANGGCSVSDCFLYCCAVVIETVRFSAATDAATSANSFCAS